MIGKAIHRILKDKISDLSTGAIYPVVMPQNAKYSLSDASSYPAVIYHNTIDYFKSKDKKPNMLLSNLSIQVVSKTYKETDKIARLIRDVLDHYVDLSKYGLADVQGYISENGYSHNFIENIDISNIFYREEEDDYYDDLFLFSRVIEYDVFYYDTIEKFSYNKGTNPVTNPLMLSLDCTQVTKDDGGAFMLTSMLINPTNNYRVLRFYNKIGSFYAKETPTSTRETYKEYLKASPNSTTTYTPVYTNTSDPAYLTFSEFNNITVFKTDYNKISLSAGAMFIFVFKPVLASTYENFLSGTIL